MTKFIKFAAFCAVFAATFSIAGCSKITVMRTREFYAMQDTLRTEIAAMQARLLEEQAKHRAELQEEFGAEQNKLLDEQKTSAEMLRLLRADEAVRFNTIERKVTAIESALTESHARLSRLDRQTAEVTRRIDQKLASDEDAANQRNMQIEKLFEIAMGDFNAGRYDLAVSGFQDLAKQFPESPFAMEAEYWIAEAYFAKKEYDKAEKEYFEFIKKHTDGSKSCAAFYKLGLAYEHQEKMKNRDMIWKNLLERCPDSNEAQAVKTQMDQQ
jgi:tol-pal system protein YbgF